MDEWYNPVAFSIGPLDIRWYALSYFASFIIGRYYCRYLIKRKYSSGISLKELDDIFLFLLIGVILGGRLGYVFFYNWPYYSSNPLEILYLWRGGMSFHGGLLGCLFTFYAYSLYRGSDFFRLSDLVFCAIPIGLGLGRIANYINGELYGRASEVYWAVRFPQGGQELRHPSQIYEAIGEGLILFLIIFYVVRYYDGLSHTKLISGIFLLFYGLIRFFIEFFREPDVQIGYIWEILTMGQILSVPMILFGIYLLFSVLPLRFHR